MGKNLLGQPSPTVRGYAPELLHAVPRKLARDSLNLAAGAELPFVGEDIWRAWELSWLDPTGTPRAGVARIAVPCHSPKLIESKSCKLYINSLSNKQFSDSTALRATLSADLGRLLGLEPQVQLLSLGAAELAVQDLPGASLDHVTPSQQASSPRPELLQVEPGQGGCWHSHLLRSLCPVTGQPDWGSVVIHCEGAMFDAPGLLAYLLSYRHHRDFHEHCVERMFLDLWQAASPTHLSVQALYTRRGGLDINPWRSSDQAVSPVLRSSRQ
ncbi:MAG: NADPH-dependent 7-cyano-7-deazaguanine reductase QueF [Halieaceae bacterium]|nr:NADPH-dependent 7-cyano-7-deazaguanine reductase QueF [Halieaceae bacterium]